MLTDAAQALLEALEMTGRVFVCRCCGRRFETETERDAHTEARTQGEW